MRLRLSDGQTLAKSAVPPFETTPCSFPMAASPAWAGTSCPVRPRSSPATTHHGNGVASKGGEERLTRPTVGGSIGDGLPGLAAQKEEPSSRRVLAHECPSWIEVPRVDNTDRLLPIGGHRRTGEGGL